MLIERMLFNLLAFSLFVYTFFKMIKDNDSNYVVLLCMQALGITVAFIELLTGRYYGNIIRSLTYLMSVVIPGLIVFLEHKGINFIELIYILISKILVVFKNNKLAKKILIVLVSHYPKSNLGHKMLAEIYEKEGGIRKAIDEYVKVIDINKKDYDAYYKIAFLLEGLNKKEEAIEMLNNLIRIKPEYYKASELLGRLLCDKEQYKEALNVYMNALKYDTGNYDIYYDMAIAYTKLNDFQNAKICYEKAAQINSLLYNAHYSLGQIALIFDDIEEAEKYFLESIKGEEVEAKSYFYLSRIYILKGEKEKAINYLNLAIELDDSLSKKALEDPVFIPIKGFVRTSKNNYKIEGKKKLSPKEEKVQKHLEDTYYLAQNLSNNDIKKMNNPQERNIKIDDRERE